MNNKDFKYGWCFSDYKDGYKIKYLEDRINEPEDWKGYRVLDYFSDNSTKNFVKDTIELCGLPYPDINSEIFRGVNHDLLFLDSHCIVIRIGYTDVEQLINPGTTTSSLDR